MSTAMSVSAVSPAAAAVARPRTLVCVPATARAPREMAAELAAAAALGADVAELRLDCLAGFAPRRDLPVILAKPRPLPALVTYRPKWEGGQYEGDDEPRFEALLLAMELGAEYVDVELKVADKFMKLVSGKKSDNCKLIVSSHNYECTPSAEELADLVAQIQATGADIVKIATTATDIVDVAKMFQILVHCQEKQVPIIGLVMNDRGFISRVLCPKYGGFLTFGTLKKGKESAPAQPTAADLINLYNIRQIGPETKVFGIIGKPVGHSKSPILHNEAFRSVGFNAVYVPFLVDDLAKFLKTYSSPDFAGFSCTIPHKEAAVRCCDEVDPIARDIGAVNTIVRRPDGKLVGYNTDYVGAISAIEDGIRAYQPMDPATSPLAGKLFVVIGAGGRNGHKVKGELMLAVWMGTQADESFPEAWHSDAASVPGDGLASIRSKVYLTPKLWYLRVNVIEAQDLIPNDKTRFPEVYVKAMLGNQVLRTRVSPSRTLNPMWNEDLMFVAAEPFEEHLILSVEDRVVPGKDEIIGRTIISLQHVPRRLDHRLLTSQWYNLEKHVMIDGEHKKETKFSSRIHLRICLEGGYHVLDESTHYSSDLRPTAKPLWKPSIGILELGILTAQGLLPMKTKDGRGTTDAYCVAKYGQKWVRTRTIIDSFTPKWNEQYTWEVYDPCTVITIGVFDNCHLNGGEKANGARDTRIGKVRIRLSTLETDRVYTHSYPLIVLTPSGVKKMGEVQLAVRFTCSSLLNMMHLYSQPLLPKMHYVHPLSVIQVDNLRRQATNIVSTRLGRAEPPLRKEIVEYMLDVDSHMWSMRKSKANFFRIMGVLSPLIAVAKWFNQICHWRNPLTTILIHVLFVILVLYPELILPTIFLYLFLIGVWYYRWRPRQPPHMDTRLSHAETAHADELDEEFDTFPTSRPPDIVRMRYDRLRSVAGRIQTVVGDLATQGERLQALLSWRDPRATALFVVFCFIAAIVLYVTPFRVVVFLAGLYVLRHPRFRYKMPSVPLNFFRRLPARTDSML